MGLTIKTILDEPGVYKGPIQFGAEPTLGQFYRFDKQAIDRLRQLYPRFSGSSRPVLRTGLYPTLLRMALSGAF